MKKTFFHKTAGFAKAHKAISAVIVIGIILGAYYGAKAASAGKTVTTYVLSTVATGTIVTTVTGTGQVSADNDQDVTAQVAGTIDSIPVSVGQSVKAGAVLAHIDSTSAEQSMESAQIAYNKLVEPPTAADIESDQNSLSQAYTSGYNTVASAMADLLTAKTDLNEDLYQSSGYIADAGPNENFIHSNQTASNEWATAGNSSDKASNLFDATYKDFEASTPSDSTTTIVDLLSKSYVTAKAMAQAVNDAEALVNFVADQDTTSKTSSNAATAQSDIQSLSSSIDNDVASLLSAQNSITNAANSLATLLQGPDALDVQSQQLSLSQAEQNYDYANVRAPFDGTVAKIDVSLDQQVDSGTAIATVVTPEEYATISLNEVDAAKVSDGQKATLTFDAIDGLSIAGTVSEVDGIGTVSQGVVTYDVKIAFDSNDSRVKPGMSVDASIITAAHANVLVVPSSAVKTRGTTSYVQELGQKYPASEAAVGVSSPTPPHNVPVTIGLSDNVKTEIVSGLAAGDQVVTKTSSVSGGGSSSAAAARPATTGAATRSFGGGGFGAIRVGG